MASSHVDRAVNELRSQLLPGRFEPLVDPLGWRCLGCQATVLATEESPATGTKSAVNRLAESAADHAMFCGRCDD